MDIFNLTQMSGELNPQDAPWDKELRQHGEYRTRRLVLDAWDRLQAGDLR